MPLTMTKAGETVMIRKISGKDEVRQHPAELGKALGCEVVEMSTLKGEGGMAAAEKAVAMAQKKKAGELPHVFTGSVEHTIAHIEESIQGKVLAGLVYLLVRRGYQGEERSRQLSSVAAAK